MSFPQTIPAVQQWFPTFEQLYEFQNDSTQIVIPTNLELTANTFQYDLFHLTGYYPSIVTTNSTTPGSIYLMLNTNWSPVLGDEGYNLTISSNPSSLIWISANTETGVFYGTRTVLQLLQQNSLLETGTIIDYPRYPVRGLHMDMGRLFVTVDWLENHIMELAYYKMNIFHWHMSEWNNFRFQSSTHLKLLLKNITQKNKFKKWSIFLLLTT